VSLSLMADHRKTVVHRRTVGARPKQSATEPSFPPQTHTSPHFFCSRRANLISRAPKATFRERADDISITKLRARLHLIARSLDDGEFRTFGALGLRRERVMRSKCCCFVSLAISITLDDNFAKA
jgi:hypothetical protein